MVDFRIVKELHDSLISGQIDKQTFAAEHIRDLATKEDYSKAFADAGVVAPLVGLLEGAMEQSTLIATEAITVLSQIQANRALIREAGGIANLVGVLRQSNDLPAEVVESLLQALSVLAAEEEAQQLTAASGGFPCIIRLVGQAPSPECLLKATQLLGRVAHAEQNKDALREAGAVVALLKLLRPRNVDPSLAEAVCQALTILAVNNEINQDYIRDQYGIAPLVKLLEAVPASGVTLAAADAVRAVAMNNNENKTAVRENWGIPLLVKLLTEDGPAVEKAVDCLRILTTGNDANKVSLFSIPAAMPALVRLMQAADQVIAERAAAVVGNLSTREEFFVTMRESGALQRLVALLDSGPTSRITEIAAKTLANLAVAESNRKGIRLAGGLPPLLRLLLERPTEQVQLAASEALKRMQVADIERNAILDTFRYMDAHIARVQAASAAQPSTDGVSQQPGQAPDANGSASGPAQPFARYSVEDTCSLLRDMGIRDTSAFEANGITGADLLDLEEDDLRSELGLSKLQVKKVRTIQTAFETFSSMMKTQGRAELTTMELREWLQGLGRSEADASAVITGFKEALGRRQMPELGFGEFARGYPWLLRTLSFMQHAAQHGFAMTQLPSFSSQPSGAFSISGETTPMQDASS